MDAPYGAMPQQLWAVWTLHDGLCHPKLWAVVQQTIWARAAGSIADMGPMIGAMPPAAMAGMDAPMMQLCRQGNERLDAHEGCHQSYGRYWTTRGAMPPPAMGVVQQNMGAVPEAMGGMEPMHMEMMPPPAMAGMDANDGSYATRTMGGMDAQ